MSEQLDELRAKLDGAIGDENYHAIAADAIAHCAALEATIERMGRINEASYAEGELANATVHMLTENNNGLGQRIAALEAENARIAIEVAQESSDLLDINRDLIHQRDMLEAENARLRECEGMCGV